MATVAELLVKIGADTSDFRKELNATKRQLKTAFGTDGMDLSSRALKGIGVLGAALAGLGVYAVKAGGDLQNVQVAMTNLLGSADKAGTFIKELQNFAAHTPFEFNDVTKASQKFLAFGFTAEQIIPTLTAVGDAAAGVGAGQDGVNRLTLALGQIAAKGRLSSEEMMQITEMGIPAWQLLADKL
ncbi:MAG: tape measure protein, partial [Dialister sp.]|nr:tape measure protein [Dialister sp.]